MTKKYRLKIPEMISSDQAELVVVLQKTYEGCELSAVGDQVYKGQGYRTDIPKNWLEEIKDEPMSAEESWEECQYCCDMDYSQTEGKSIFLEGFHAGAVENGKKYLALIGAVSKLYGIADHDSISSYTQLVFNEFEKITEAN